MEFLGYMCMYSNKTSRTESWHSGDKGYIECLIKSCDCLHADGFPIECAKANTGKQKQKNVAFVCNCNLLCWLAFTVLKTQLNMSCRRLSSTLRCLLLGERHFTLYVLAKQTHQHKMSTAPLDTIFTLILRMIQCNTRNQNFITYDSAATNDPYQRSTRKLKSVIFSIRYIGTKTVLKVKDPFLIAFCHMLIEI